MNNYVIHFFVGVVLLLVVMFLVAWLDKRKKDKEAAKKAYYDAFERKALDACRVNNPRVTSSGSIASKRHSLSPSRYDTKASSNRKDWLDDDSLNMGLHTHSSVATNYSGGTEYHGNYSGGSCSSGSSSSSDYSSSYSNSSGSSCSSSCSGSYSSSSDSGSSCSSSSSSSCD